MNKRLNYYQASPATLDGLSAYGRQLAKAFGDPKLQALIDLRVSQINGCAFCVDLHSHEACKLGETTQRLDCLSVWREVSFYSAREKAAFAWAEAVTLVSESRVPDEVYGEVVAQFDGEQLVVLTALIGVINAWNRIAISFRNAPVARQPATSAAAHSG